MQNTLVNNALLRWGTEEQSNATFLTLAGDSVAAYALSEAGSGADAFALATRAERRRDGFVLNGRKLWITNGNEADLFIVFAKLNPVAGYKGITAFLVERGFAGFAIGKKETSSAFARPARASWIFEDCAVPEANVLGEVGRGYKVAIETLNEGRIGIGAQMVGLAQGALDHAMRYTKERKQFGKPSPSSRACSFSSRAPRPKSRRRGCSSTTRRGCAMPAQPFVNEAAMCKLFASEVAERVASLAVNLFGGYGFVKDYPVEKLYRDAKIGKIYEGTSNLQLQTIAKHLLSIARQGFAGDGLPERLGNGPQTSSSARTS